MVKKTNADDALKDFWQDNENFAKVFNEFFFENREVVRPADLLDVDSVASAASPDEAQRRIKQGDVVKLWRTGATQQILCIENQTYIDYGMALREKEERAAFVGDQRRRLMQKNRKAKVTGAAYLSGMLPTDRVIPIYILTIYYGADVWDAPLDYDALYAPHISLGKRYNKTGVTLLDAKTEEMRDPASAVTKLFDLLKLRSSTAPEDFLGKLATHLYERTVGEAEMKAFAHLTRSTVVMEMYEFMRRKRGEGADMGLALTEWEDYLMQKMNRRGAEKLQQAEEKYQQVEEKYQQAEKSRQRAEESRQRAEEECQRTEEKYQETAEKLRRSEEERQKLAEKLRLLEKKMCSVENEH